MLGQRVWQYDRRPSSGLQVFIEEKVDVAILEVGLGGRLDATNCIPSPPVCGVTSLGMDHVEILGDTIEVSRGSFQSAYFCCPSALRSAGSPIALMLHFA